MGGVHLTIKEVWWVWELVVMLLRISISFGREGFDVRVVKKFIIPADPNFPETERQEGSKGDVVVNLYSCSPIPNDP